MLQRTKANLGPPGVLLVCLGFGGLSFSVWGPVSLVAWRQRFSHRSAQKSIRCPVGRGSIQEGGALEEWVSRTAPAAWSPQGPLAWVSAASPLFSRSQKGIRHPFPSRNRRAAQVPRPRPQTAAVSPVQAVGSYRPGYRFLCQATPHVAARGRSSSQRPRLRDPVGRPPACGL